MKAAPRPIPCRQEAFITEATEYDLGEGTSTGRNMAVVRDCQRWLIIPRNKCDQQHQPYIPRRSPTKTRARSSGRTIMQFALRMVAVHGNRRAHVHYWYLQREEDADSIPSFVEQLLLQQMKRTSIMISITKDIHSTFQANTSSTRLA